MKQYFSVHKRLPSLTDIIAIAKSQTRTYSAYNEMKHSTDMRVRAGIRGNGVKPFLDEHLPIDVHFHWVEEEKRRDHDNIRAAAKFILDGLVEEKIIKNDGWGCIGNLSDSYSIDKKNPRVEVILMPGKGDDG